MSNTNNNNMQTQTSSALYNAIMQAGGKDRPPMLAPGNYHPPYKFKWTERTITVAEDSSETTTEGYMENYKNVSEDIRNLLNAEAEAKAIERLKQGESINVQDLETNLYWEFGKFTSRDGESIESYYLRFYKMKNELSQEFKTVSYHKLYDIPKQHHNEVNEIRAERLACTANPLALVAQQQPVYHSQPHPTYYTQNSSTISQQAATRNRDDALSKEKEIDKLMALISLSFKKIYKPTNNNFRTAVNIDEARENAGTQVVHQSGIQCYNCKEFRHVARECQKPKRAKAAAYHKEKMLLYQKLEAHYLYMAKIQEVTSDVVDNSGPIFDDEPLQKIQNDDDNYNVFANDREHPKQPESVNDTYPNEQGDTNITNDSLVMSTNRGKADQDDDDDLARERDLLASLIEKI
ncbi:retrovirus-related pol polyprotein from transposon TNT 1-94 [Tanacetum coccineum]|uniref:Retrovirus-related pol polyprotein from transposon TNT 1-94 n=1 Tax=Tanacetum coccineum TaxID=301880 RepID=A0ABQ5GGI9_9ASTR